MTLKNTDSIRILQVVGGMNPGGIETWLMHVLRHINRDRFHIDFLVHTPHKCAYDEEILALGSKIIPCLNPSRPLTYAANFKRSLSKYGAYDIVHSHVYHFSGYVLRLARQANIPTCIAHSHTDASSLEAKAGWYRRLYLALMKRWIARYATVGLGVSHKAVANLFGSNWNDPRWRVLYCGTDLTLFRNAVNPAFVRDQLGIPADALIIGHVGRFVEVKNHNFLIEIMTEVTQRESQAYLLLVGDGPLRATIEQQVAQAGLTDRVIFAGIRSDVPRLMLGAMDVLLLPSFYEGLGLVLIEAQAAGLPCIFSDVIPEEADVVKPLVQRISLSQPASDWANAIAAIKTQLRINQAEALKLVEQSPFNIQTSVKELEKLYLEQSKHSFE